MVRLILRVLVGTLFMGHGLQKLKGWFGTASRAPASSSRASGCARGSATPRRRVQPRRRAARCSRWGS